MNGRRGELEGTATNGGAGACWSDNGIEHSQRISGAVKTDGIVQRVVDVEADHESIARHTLGWTRTASSLKRVRSVFCGYQNSWR